MIFDSLTHITENGAWLNTHHDASLGRLLQSVECSRVTKSLLVGLLDDSNNEYVLKVAQKYPDQFVPVYGIDPKGKSTNQIAEELIAMKKKGFGGIKIHPRFSRMPMSDEKIIKTIQLAHESRLFSMLCTVHKHPSSPLKRPVYDVIHEICHRIPDAAIIFVHGGYYDLLQTSEILRGYPNTLLDISYTLNRFHETSIGLDIKFLFKTFDKRICIGSDFPELEMSGVLAVLEEKYFPFLNKEKIENIKFVNLDKITCFYGSN